MECCHTHTNDVVTRSVCESESIGTLHDCVDKSINLSYQNKVKFTKVSNSYTLQMRCYINADVSKRYLGEYTFTLYGAMKLTVLEAHCH